MRRAIQDATACREALLSLPKLGLGELRQQWRVLYKAEASPYLSREPAPASVAENVETVLRVENQTQRPRSRSEAITDVIGGFVGTISFVVAQL
jgi:hypothetical protein